MALLALVLITAGWAQITVGLRPLVRLRARVAVVHSDPGKRMDGAWPAEVGALAHELDELLDTRTADLARARMRAGDLAHGLKTPLQALMGEAARLHATGAAAQAQGIEEVVATMRRTVDRELARARRLEGAAPARSNLRQTLERVLNVIRKTPDGQRVDWVVDVPDSLWMPLDPLDLTEALGAVIENAARHARRTVHLMTACHEDQWHLRISDDGPGIPAAQQQAMLARFARLDESGSGMGLAIAAEIIRTAGGDITLSDARPGLCVDLGFPALGPALS